MTRDEIAAVTGLVREHAGTRYLKVLECAQDIWDALGDASAPAAPRMPWEPDLSFVTGIQVTVVPDWEPGRWKLTRHDACDVIGGHTVDDALIVSHHNCTVLGENR